MPYNRFMANIDLSRARREYRVQLERSLDMLVEKLKGHPGVIDNDHRGQRTSAEFSESFMITEIIQKLVDRGDLTELDARSDLHRLLLCAPLSQFDEARRSGAVATEDQDGVQHPGKKLQDLRELSRNA